jgi:hypothetical protein
MKKALFFVRLLNKPRLALKHECLTPIMSINMNMARKSALYLASSSNIL